MASQAPKQVATRGAGGNYRGRGRGDGQHWRGRGRGGAGRGSWRGSHQRPRGPGGNDSENSRPTHFLSLPLDQHQALRSRVQNFQDGLLSSHRSSPIPGFDDRLFQQTQRLHMTLGVMALADGSSTQADRSTNTPGSASGSGQATTTPSEEVPLEAPSAPKKTVAEALELLNSLRPEITEIINDSGNISVALSGLNIMNNRPEEAYVLWAGPGTNNDGSSLWKISLLVHNRFKEAGFVVENRPLKLHCTILNSTFRRPRQAFSSTEILRRVAVQPEIAGIQTNEKSSVTPDDAASEADFGTYGVDEIHLWKMGSWDEEKRYVSSGHISLG